MATRTTAIAADVRRRAHPPPAAAAVASRNQAMIGALQRTLRVGEAGDRLEREADSAADAVMRMPQPAVQRCPGGCPGEEEVQRQPMEEEEELLQGKDRLGGTRLDAATAGSISSARGNGTALPAAERSFFEPRFQRDFGSVRLHADRRAADLSQQVNARAFTVGSDIFFGAGEYRPGTDGGRRLVAHELTHVVQQSG